MRRPADSSLASMGGAHTGTRNPTPEHLPQLRIKVELDLNKRSIHLKGSYLGANARGDVHVTPLLPRYGGLANGEFTFLVTQSARRAMTAQHGAERELNGTVVPYRPETAPKGGTPP